MKKKTFLEYIREADFRGLFISEMGWNNYRGQAALPLITIDEVDYQFYTIAERSGFQIVECEVEAIPTSAICKRIDTKLRRSANDYIAIYVQKGTEHHQWVAPVRQMEKRDLVTIEYETADKADFLFAKIDGLSFENSERTTIVDVKERIQGTFAVNSEEVTKNFYAGFKKEHDAFAKFITGIDDHITNVKKNRNKQWYTLVMLNRLMFCYFIQKKGFLDGNVNYLKDKLLWCQKEKGEDRFFKSFYQGFLVQLFQDGLNSPTHQREFEDTYGRIPYLNGGMFDRHQIEQDYANIDIADEAFEQLFDFFDKWRWHLDTRISASGKDINPDVLGYIFEQYINDRAQMGAYYTKEDITEYIGRNCILPFLFDKVQHSTQEMEQCFHTNGEVWQLLQQSGDKFVFDAVKHGYSEDWKVKIPQEISRGLDTDEPNLLERRADWNRPTPEPYALPTEIWRETIDRLQRCESILDKIRKGEITEINDFITYNLDIRGFAQELLSRTANHKLVGHFYKALQHVTILDPTCGSGAFLFAAMNILEPLYEVCIDRMQEFNAQNPHLFKEELAEIQHKYRSNIQYFIYKSIILRNLYGVDIMQEATEIAKLRLFLKMVAVVEANRRLPNLGLDPLPDIDFNIRCGNTLVGYATENEVLEGVVYNDMFAAQEYREKIELQLEAVSMAYEHFRTQQLADANDMASIKESKKELRQRLTSLTDLFDHQMFSANGGPDFDAWKASHQPFHWVAEYYQIMHENGGFDVIIGNPPYVSMSIIDYIDIPSNFKCSDLYAYVIRRTYGILSKFGNHGFIVMHNLAFSRNFKDLRRFLKQTKGSYWFSFYSRIPSGLFSGDVRVRNTIYLYSNKGNSRYTSRMHRWFTEQRPSLFQNQNYCTFAWNDCVPMLNDSELQNVFENKSGTHIRLLKDKNGSSLYFKKVAYNWLVVSEEEPPTYDENKNLISSPGVDVFHCSRKWSKYFLLLSCGKLYFTKWLTYGDDFHYTISDLCDFTFPFEQLTREEIIKLDNLYVQFVKALPATLKFKLNAGKNVGTYNTSSLWHITDVSDMIFLSHLTECPQKIREQMENQIAVSVITDKGKSSSSIMDEEE